MVVEIRWDIAYEVFGVDFDLLFLLLVAVSIFHLWATSI